MSPFTGLSLTQSNNHLLPPTLTESVLSLLKIFVSFFCMETEPVPSSFLLLYFKLPPVCLYPLLTRCLGLNKVCLFIGHYYLAWQIYLSPQQYSSKEKRCLVGDGPHTDEVLLPQKEEVAKIRWCGKQSWETSPGSLSVHTAFCYYLQWDLIWMDFLEHRPPSLPSYHKPCLTAFPTLRSKAVL